jgi:type II restriction/modification system DNA methylase subunit YeeA
MLQNGYEYNRNPILKPLDNIENRDALINADGTEAQWPVADVIVGNPPFLGDKKMLAELGDDYVNTLRKTYKGKVPGGADLVCYWFEKSRAQITLSKLKAAGLVSTNSIRGGSNRTVLDHICKDSRIFNAWSDEEWINEGAAVRVSLICFSDKNFHQDATILDGNAVSSIFADLTGSSEDAVSVDVTRAKDLNENTNTAFIGTQKSGGFDISGNAAREWLKEPNPNNILNNAVIRPWANGSDVTRRPSDTWIIDFGINMSQNDASLFEKPYSFLQSVVEHSREGKREIVAAKWWLHTRPRPDMRKAMHKLERYIITPRVSKYRVFAWMNKAVLPDSATAVFVRSDDTTFGILHCRFHQIWSLAMCTWLGKGNDPRYTPTTCFETYPFPQGLTPADTLGNVEITEEGYWLPPVDNSVMEKAIAIASAAFKLNQLRNNWLNPTEWVDWERTTEEEQAGFPLRPVAKLGKEAELKKRTLTNLYNLQPTWLLNSHKTLDKAVAEAYGWNDYTPEMSDDEILSRLLKLNLER